MNRVADKRVQATFDTRIRIGMYDSMRCSNSKAALNFRQFGVEKYKHQTRIYAPRFEIRCSTKSERNMVKKSIGTSMYTQPIPQHISKLRAVFSSKFITIFIFYCIVILCVYDCRKQQINVTPLAEMIFVLPLN